MTVKELMDLLKEMPLNAEVTSIGSTSAVEIEIEEVIEYDPTEVQLIGRERELIDT